MTSEELLRRRMHNQRLGKSDFEAPSHAVKWFCAMQAQDYLGALWSVGQRVAKCRENDIEDAIARKENHKDVANAGHASLRRCG